MASLLDIYLAASASARSSADPDEALDRPLACAPKAQRTGRFQVTDQIRGARAAVEGDAPAVIIHGGAGTGRTRLIGHLLKRSSEAPMPVVAPTRVAALNAGGRTIHSAFSLPPHGVLDPNNLPDIWGRPHHHWRNVLTLVIDEISMVRADVLDSIDSRLRGFLRNPLSFGGIQVVMVGDPFQLPPVVKEEDWELLGELGYRAPYFHSARVWEDIEPLAVELTRVFRQSDPKFIRALNTFRPGRNLGSTIDFLNEVCCGSHRKGCPPILLTPTRAAAEHHNRAGLKALPGASMGYHGRRSGNFGVRGDNLPAPEELVLKAGAEVMAVKNDQAGRWVNGSRGHVESLEPDGVIVHFYDTGAEHSVGPESWETVRQHWNPSWQRVETEVIGAYRQIPLIPGWALTMHKAQGLTLDDVRVDLGTGAFAAGQLYVALSRARSLDGLSLARPIQVDDVRTDPRLDEIAEWLERAATPGRESNPTTRSF